MKPCGIIRNRSTLMKYYLIAVMLGLSVMTIHSSEAVPDEVTLENAALYPMEILLSPEKETYRLREKITFTVTVKSLAAVPIPVLVRGTNGKEPLGRLELHSVKPKKGKRSFDVCQLGCGTSLENGWIEPGSAITMKFSIGENSTWGPAGPYQFIFRLASAQATRNESYRFQAASNVAKIELIE